ncbi:peptidoglycan editing factor PgeF [Bacillus songklensis]|uniref:Purine nucleoside phosphorylase n=1 Tax=Bacillus songklensis TaxID=1069116 RepID=A0ABV8B0J6_9BACI
MKESDKLVVGFTTKNGGFSIEGYQTLNLGLHVQDVPSTVVANREVVAKQLEMPLSKWVCAEQVHQSRIAKVTKADSEKGVYDYKEGIPQTDGIYTNQTNILLTLCFADCVPLYFFAPKYNMIGLAHAGWRGTVENIGGKMIEKWMQEEGIPLHDIYAAIGPAIEACCYIVDDKVIDLVKNVLDDQETSFYSLVSEGQYALDLKEVNKQLLLKAGVSRENILMSTLCTSCEKDVFFSHRRDQGKTGRMLSFIGYKED